MSRQHKLGVLLLLSAVAGLCTLRADLSRWQLARGDRLYLSGDLRGALTAWSSATIAPSARPLAHLSRGAAHYRLGELAAASSEFRAAAASAEPAIRQQALYNLGTTLLVMDWQKDAADRGEAEQRLTEAVRLLQAAVELSPADTDAGQNRAMAQSRLVALAEGRPRAASPPLTPDKKEHAAATAKQPGQTGSNAGKPGAATNLDYPSGRRRAAPPMSADQAMRMLDDARGREILRSSQVSGNRQGQLTPPEKDW